MLERTVKPIQRVFSIGRIRWSWVGVGFCFYMTFHLFPSTLLGMTSCLTLMWLSGRFILFLLWLYVGIALVAGYIGYRSRGKTFIESGLAAIFYIFFPCSGVVLDFWDKSSVSQLSILFVTGAASAVLSNFVGRLLQTRRELKLQKLIASST